MAADQNRSIEAARRLQAALITGHGVVSALTWASCQIPAFRAVLFLAAVKDRLGHSADWVAEILADWDLASAATRRLLEQATAEQGCRG